MKTKFLFAFFFLASSWIGYAKNNCTIKGTVTDSGHPHFFIRNLTLPVNDTVQIIAGKFTYACELKEPTPMLISDEKNRYQLFFAEPNCTISIQMKREDLQLLDIHGSASHEIFRQLLTANEPIQKFAMGVQQGFSNPALNRDSLQQVLQVANSELRKNFFQFLTTHKSSEVSSFIVYNTISNDRNIQTQTADSMFSILQGKALSSFYGKELQKMISKLRAIEVGYMAPDFTLPDTSGNKMYTLSKLRGQYVLIDFWASWCGPCKGEIPYLKKAYEKFHTKGFEIMSVSLDDKKQNWLQALQQFQMPWIHVSDVKGFNSKVNDLYHVPAIPKTLLLDKNGKIIAADLRGEMLERKLSELFAK